MDGKWMKKSQAPSKTYRECFALIRGLLKDENIIKIVKNE